MWPFLQRRLKDKHKTAPTPGSGTDFVFKAAKPGSQGYYVFALPQNKNSIVKID